MLQFSQLFHFYWNAHNNKSYRHEYRLNVPLDLDFIRVPSPIFGS